MILGYGVIAVPTGIVTVEMAHAYDKHISTQACQYVSRGMSPEDVKKLLGKPSGEKHSYSNERYDTWSYGTAKVNFDAQGVVLSVTDCNKRDASLDDTTSPH